MRFVDNVKKIYRVTPASCYSQTICEMTSLCLVYSLNVCLNSELSLLCSTHGYQPLKPREVHFIHGLKQKHLFSPLLTKRTRVTKSNYYHNFHKYRKIPQSEQFFLTFLYLLSAAVHHTHIHMESNTEDNVTPSGNVWITGRLSNYLQLIWVVGGTLTACCCSGASSESEWLILLFLGHVQHHSLINSFTIPYVTDAQRFTL